MNNKFHIISLIIFFLFINYSFADEKIKRIDKVSKNLRCLICQGQSVYDSQSEFALSIRDLIIKKIDEGETDDEIYDYLKVKYGDWIIYDPKFDKNTILLWLIPLILFIFGGLLIFRKVIIIKSWIIITLFSNKSSKIAPRLISLSSFANCFDFLKIKLCSPQNFRNSEEGIFFGLG